MILHNKKILLIITGVIALVVLAGILALLLNIKAFTPQIEAAASTALGMDVRIKGRVGIAFFPGFGLSLKDVSVRNKGLDVVTIEKMRIRLKLIPLARFEIKIIQVELVKPVFSIVRSKNGMFNFEKPGRTSWEKLLAMKKISIPPKTIEGPINFSADLTATGKSADEAKRSLNGDLSLNGENLMLYSIDIDAFIMKYERSRNFNLVDLAAFLLAGPIGPVLTKSYNFARLLKESQGGKGTVRKLVSVWKVKNGIAEARDVALASKKQRIAMTGGLNFINEQFVDVTAAVLDKQGCAVYSENVHGPFREPQIEKESVFRSIAGSVLNPLGDAWKFIQGEECTVFYSGSVAQPEG